MDDDKNWYRALVTSIEDNMVETFYCVSLLDFGDEILLPCENLAVIEAQFLKLKFQAVECQLANITPIGYIKNSFITNE